MCWQDNAPAPFYTAQSARPLINTGIKKNMMSLAFVALALAPAPMNTGKVFEVEGRKFTGSNSRVCIIEGRWSDGEPFRYQAWDACEKMTMKWVAPMPSPEMVEQVNGTNRRFVVPAGSESFHIGNDLSVVRVFRNFKGELEEILVSD